MSILLQQIYSGERKRENERMTNIINNLITNGKFDLYKNDPNPYDNSPMCKCPFGDDYDCFDCTSLKEEIEYLQEQHIEDLISEEEH